MRAYLVPYGSVNPRPTGGRGETAHCAFPSIAQKPKGIELRNFQNLFLHQLCTFWPKGKFRNYDRSAVSDVRVTSCSAILGKKIRVCGNCGHTLIFKDKDNRKRLVYAEKNGLRNCYLGFLECWKFWKVGDVFNIFFFAKIIQISKFIAFWFLNLKNGYLSGHLDVIPCSPIYSFYSDFYATNDVLRSFVAF